jgi:hypothetical protein
MLGANAITFAREQPLWVESGRRALAVIYCASVSPDLRCVSMIVRRRPGSVSADVRRKRRSIARRAVHHCAPPHLETYALLLLLAKIGHPSLAMPGAADVLFAYGSRRRYLRQLDRKLCGFIKGEAFL